MTPIKVLGPTLVAAFALAAIAAAGASAGTAPEFFECKKAEVAGTGHHSEKSCSDAYKETGGSYNLVPGIGKAKPFKAKGGEATLHTVNPEGEVDIPVTCQKVKGAGSEAMPNIILKVTTTFSKCKALSAPCENVKKETISTVTLAGNLGWINKAGKRVGTVLSSEASPGGLVAEFTCAAIGQIRTSGAVIGENAGNVGVVSKTSTLKFEKGPFLGKVVWDEKGDEYTPQVNIPKFEGGPLEILETRIKGKITGHPEEFYPSEGLPSGQEGTSEQKGEAVEIAEEGTV